MTFFKNESDKINNWFAIGLVVHLICAYFSMGYWQPDEHFQILEFLNSKLYQLPPTDLAWEYNAKIRPWFQVFIYYVFSKPLKGLDPFLLAAYLRIITSLFSFISVLFLTKTVFLYLKKDTEKKYWAIFINLFWFMPFLHARTSSETFSMGLFFIGMYYFLKEEKGFFAGLFLGLSFISRFQMGLMILPLYLYSFILKKRLSLLSILAVLFAISLGVLIDYWGHGAWAFTPWNYFKVNLLEGKAAEFGVMPWWYYFKEILLKGGGPLGLLLLFATFWGWIKYPKNPITWISAFFLFSHMLIGHKELRFLTPLFPLSIFYLVILNPIKQKTIIGLGLINLVLLVYIVFMPVRSNFIFKKYLYKNSIGVLYTSDEDPFKRHGLNDSFFRPKALKVIDFTKWEDISQSKIPFYFATNSLSETLSLLENNNCQNRFLEYPQFFIEKLLSKVSRKSRFWSLFYCKF